MGPRDQMDAAKNEVEMGNVAFPATLPPKRRRPTEEVPAQPRRPDWADATEESDREDAAHSGRSWYVGCTTT